MPLEFLCLYPLCLQGKFYFDSDSTSILLPRLSNCSVYNYTDFYSGATFLGGKNLTKNYKILCLLCLAESPYPTHSYCPTSFSIVLHCSPVTLLLSHGFA